MTAPIAWVEVDAGEGARRIRVTGEIDMSNVSTLGAQLADACVGAERAVLDVSSVTYLNSQALHMLQRLGDQLTADGTGLIVVARPDSVAAKLFDLTGMAGDLDIRPSFDG